MLVLSYPNGLTKFLSLYHRLRMTSGELDKSRLLMISPAIVIFLLVGLNSVSIT